MAQTKLSILIDTIFKGQGATQAKKALDDLDTSGQKSSKSMISVKDALKGVEAGMFAVGVVGATFKKAFDLAQEGAQIEKVANTFDALAVSAGTTADILLGDLRNATQGMVSDLDLMQSANQFLAMGLANTGDEAAELARVAVTLGAAMGKDATQSMEEFSLLLANQSIPRLDTFGISAGTVRTRINELREANEGMTRETAFMTAVMEEAEKSMEIVGDSVPIDAFTQLEVRVQNATDAFKVMLSDGLEPWVAFVLGDFARAVESGAEATINLDDRMEKLASTFKGTQTFFGIFTGANEELRKAIVDTATEMIAGADTAKEWETSMEAAGLSADDLRKILVVQTDNLDMTTEAFFNANKAIADTISFDKALLIATELSNAELRKTSEILPRTSDKTEELADKEAQLATQLDRGGVAIAKHRAELNQSTGAVEELSVAIASGADFVSAMSGDIKFFTQDLDDLGQQFITVGGRTREQNADLGLLQNGYDKAAKRLKEYELGLRGGNLETDALNEAMQKEVETMAELQGRMEPLVAITGEYAEINNEATIDQEALTDAIFDAAVAQDASAVELAALGAALGLYSDEAVEAALQTVLIQGKIDELTKAFLDGDLSIEGVRTRLASFIEDINATDDLRLEIDTLEAEAALVRVQQALDNITQTASGDLQFGPPGGGNGGGGTSGNGGQFETPDGTLGPPAQFGMDMIVPTGFPNDNFFIPVSSGERVLVQTPNQQGGSGGAGNINVSVAVPAPLTAPPQTLGRFVASITASNLGDRMKG